MQVLLKSLIPPQFLIFVSPIVLVLIGIYVERKYMSRVSIFANAAALFTLYYPIEMPTWLGILINAIIVLGIIAGIAYATNSRLSKQYYQISWIASSVVTAFLMVLAFVLLGELPSESIQFMVNLKNMTII
jgi:hypothetical protein